MRVFSFVFTISFLFFEAPYASAMSCGAILGPSSKNYTKLTEDFHKDMTQLDAVLENLKVKSLEMIPEKVLGFGHSGGVIKVNFEGKSYALKLVISQPIFRPKDLRINREAVIIQRIMGDMDMAPKIIGILDKAQTEKYVSANMNVLTRLRGFETFPYEFGILMELVNSHTTKNPPRMFMTKEQKKSLASQAEAYGQRLAKLGIVPDDMDFTVAPDGRLLLIDIGYYDYLGPNPSFFQRYEIKKIVKELQNTIRKIKEIKTGN